MKNQIMRQHSSLLNGWRNRISCSSKEVECKRAMLKTKSPKQRPVTLIRRTSCLHNSVRQGGIGKITTDIAGGLTSLLVVIA